MAVNFSAFTRQPDDQEGMSSDGKATHSISYKGEYSALRVAARALSVGERIEAFNYLDSWNLRRTAGDLGVLTLNCTVLAESENSTSGVLEQQTNLLKDVWSLRSVRNDVSIMGYCGGGSGEASRALVEAWQKEPDGKLADQNKYTDAKGEVQEIKDNATLDVIGKIRSGIESVMRFYPLITRTRTYDAEPPACYENLAKVDTPSVPLRDVDIKLDKKERKTRVPTGLAAIVNNHTWLKCQDDCNEQADGKWTRVEAWMGVATWCARTAWDPDLYGSNPWTMPHSRTGSNDFGNQTGGNK